MAVVGMEMTSYTVTEDGGAMVEVCAIVHSPNDTRCNCPIQFPFTITGLSTINETAGNRYHRVHDKKNGISLVAVSSEDYVAVSNSILMFDRCQRKVGKGESAEISSVLIPGIYTK